MVRHSDYVSELHFELKLIPTNVPDSDVHISKTREIAVKYVNNLFVMLLVIFFFNFGPALGHEIFSFSMLAC